MSQKAESTTEDELDVELLEAEKELAEAKARLLKARNRRREKKKQDNRHASAAAVDLTAVDTPPTVTPKKRLSAKRRRQKRLSEDNQKRTPKPDNQKLLRQMLGKVLKINMDSRLLAREFIGPQNVFDLPKFEDAVNPILDYFEKTDDIDTCGFTRFKMFRVLVDVAKKRSDYTPKKKIKRRDKPNKKLPYASPAMLTRS
jgi:hypothetical protein